MVIKYRECCDNCPRGRVVIPRATCGHHDTSHRSKDTQGIAAAYVQQRHQSRRKRSAYSLWVKQFERWWNYNFMRKRKEHLGKHQFDCKCSKRKSRVTNPPTTSSSDSSIVEFSPAAQCRACSFIPPRCCVPPCCGCRPEPITKRRLKREYQTRIKDLSSSDSDISICVKPKPCMRELSKDSGSDGNNLKPKVRKPTPPRDFSSRSANFAASDPDNKKMRAGRSQKINLKSVDIRDRSFIPRPKFDWTGNYDRIRREHVKLLETVCSVMSSAKSENSKPNVNPLEDDLYDMWLKLPKGDKDSLSFKDFSARLSKVHT